MGTARFNDLTLMYEGESAAALVLADSGKIITIEEAHHNGDLLTISWHLNDSPTARTTRLTKLSAYE